MASTNTKTVLVENSKVKIMKINMVCAVDSAAFTNVILDEQGKRLFQITTVPGSTGPTDDSDLALTDSLTGVDMMSTNGVDIVDNSSTNNALPDTVSNVILGQLTLAISNNSVNNAETNIYLIFLKSF